MTDPGKPRRWLDDGENQELEMWGTFWGVTRVRVRLPKIVISDGLIQKSHHNHTQRFEAFG